MQLVVFSLGNEEYGIIVDHVDEIIRYAQPVALPKAHPSVLGIINLRDRVIPIVCFRRRFEMKSTEVTNETRIIIGELFDQLVGFVVDSVSEVMEVSGECIEEYDGRVYGADHTSISGICKLNERIVVLLDLERVMETTRVS